MDQVQIVEKERVGNSSQRLRKPLGTIERKPRVPKEVRDVHTEQNRACSQRSCSDCYMSLNLDPPPGGFPLHSNTLCLSPPIYRFLHSQSMGVCLADHNPSPKAARPTTAFDPRSTFTKLTSLTSSLHISTALRADSLYQAVKMAYKLADDNLKSVSSTDTSCIRPPGLCFASLHSIYGLETDRSRLFESGFFADVEIICGKDHQVIRAHKAILANRSPYFNAAFDGNWKVSLTPTFKSVTSTDSDDRKRPPARYYLKTGTPRPSRWFSNISTLAVCCVKRSQPSVSI